ncbi:hypothetical protein CSUI_001777, partial [Cystoisospora suis]
SDRLPHSSGCFGCNHSEFTRVSGSTAAAQLLLDGCPTRLPPTWCAFACNTLLCRVRRALLWRCLCRVDDFATQNGSSP